MTISVSKRPECLMILKEAPDDAAMRTGGLPSVVTQDECASSRLDLEDFLRVVHLLARRRGLLCFHCRCLWV